MKLTVYRCGIPSGLYDRGGVWYSLTLQGLFLYIMMYRKEGRLSYLTEKEITVDNPFILNMKYNDEKDYPILAYYVAENNFSKEAIDNDNRDLAEKKYRIYYGRYIDTEIKPLELENPERADELLSDTEYFYSWLERKLSRMYKERGYDSILFLVSGKPEQIFVFT